MFWFRKSPLGLLVALAACARPALPPTGGAADYFPAAGAAWQHQAPTAAGFEPSKLAEAVAFAQTQETTQMTPNFSTQEEIFGKLLGPMPTSRAATNGLVLRHGYLVAEWGDTERPDPTYSVAKSFLATLLGLSVDGRLIKDVRDPVANYVHDGGYDSPHNRLITWEHHARQTSEWEGELWGKNADFIGHEAFGKGERQPRPIQDPGTYFEYNDVRINRLALSLLRLWEQPLPAVLKQKIMDPIGASATWNWVPYPTAVAQVKGQALPSVSGGTRWGVGLRISARDEARFGYLMLRQGRWASRQLVSASWIKQATTRGPVGPDYGLMWWLNTDKKAWPDVPATSYAALGAGSNTIWIDPEHDLVIVWRWHSGSPNELAKRVLAALN